MGEEAEEVGAGVMVGAVDGGEVVEVVSVAPDVIESELGVCVSVGREDNMISVVAAVEETADDELEDASWLDEAWDTKDVS